MNGEQIPLLSFDHFRRDAKVSFRHSDDFREQLLALGGAKDHIEWILTIGLLELCPKFGGYVNSIAPGGSEEVRDVESVHDRRQEYPMGTPMTPTRRPAAEASSNTVGTGVCRELGTYVSVYECRDRW